MALGKYGTIRTLIVDDDRTIGEVLRELLSKEGGSVDVVADGVDAVSYLKRTPVDILITDLMMPNVGGLEVLRQAKLVNQDVVVIIITGHASLETAIEAVREGAYNYIKKPFKLQEIEISFDNAMEKVGLVRENRKLVAELAAASDQLVAASHSNERPSGEDVAHETESSQSNKGMRDRISRLNFFSSNAPVLQVLNRSRLEHLNPIDQLSRLSDFKRDGLLSEDEFSLLKARLFRDIMNS